MNEAQIADKPAEIAAFSLISMKHRLKMEMKGIRFKGRSTFAIVKEMFDLRGRNADVFRQFQEILVKRGIPHE